MVKEPLKVIGINPGTRYLGIAILYGQELMDWRIKVLNGKWSREKLKKVTEIISELVDQYEPSVLVIKKLHLSRRTENLLRLTDKIKEVAKYKKMKVYQYSIKEIEGNFIDGKKLNRRNLIETMIEFFPVLHNDLNKERNHKNPYYFRMFEAVALASVCSKKQRIS